MENMAWQAIACGANGLLFYSFHDVFRDDPSKAHERWEDVKKVAGAIRAHESTLLEIGPVPEIAGETDTISARVYNGKDGMKMLVVNAAREAQKVSLKIADRQVEVELKALEAKWLKVDN
jgi:hypothetical protein